ncbi:hypothetical protein DSCO28_24430 [Desulfosarcina ovata subsp. sediminis]|uniref:DUF4340 domain-containing protein n=1 Tax=Desulfosarcina ovata subsp. sediminis TaxID=885957 RepID=A0A5K7ZNJ5_9BACT|nr:DUF4340 domain-containing protein [Desulfosarcina ovata]BBO81877.1 hypothetical protein DSCO28_24430 [Desulfosarcina ovata subsp. sediminis]
MKGKTFLILLVAAGVLVALAAIRLGDKPAGETKMGAKLFADLPVNEVATVIIADTDNQVTLKMGATVWQVEERSGYPADFGELRDTVVKLLRLKIGRSFTATPESLARLTLLAPSEKAEKGQGTAITLKDGKGNLLADVILGQTRTAEGGGTGGQYLKLAEGETVFLVDGDFRFLKTAPEEWLADEILNIKADSVAAVTAYAAGADAPVYTLTRPEKDKAAEMDPVPAGRTVDQAKIDQVLDALAPLSLSDVRRAEGETPLQGDRLVYRLFDGREITIFPRFDGKETYTLRVAAGSLPVTPETTETADTAAADAGDSETAPVDDKADGEKTPAAQKPPAVMTAQQINDQLGPWIFSVKKWQYDSFIFDSAALLKSVESKDGKTS